MKLSDFPHLITELNHLATMAILGIDARIGKDNTVYKAIKDKESLDIVGEDLSQESLLLLVKIIAELPILQTIRIIGQHDIPKVVVELVKLKPSKSMDLDGVNLEGYDSLTVAQLTASLPLEIIIASELYGLSVAIELAKSSFSLNKVYTISSHYSGCYGKGIFEKIDSHNNLHKQLPVHLASNLPLLGELRELVTEYYWVGQYIELVQGFVDT